MKSKRRILPLLGCFVASALAATPLGAQLTPLEELGKAIFFDNNLSMNSNQSCASCHTPDAGWTGPIAGINAAGAVYEGSIAGRFGNRKPPSSAYATLSPVFHFEQQGQELLPVGGNFWDGRATGERLGNPAADQAQGPFVNPAEQALPDSACVVHRVCTTTAYPVSFTAVFGAGACDITWPGNIGALCTTEGSTVPLTTEDRADADSAYDSIALAIAAYEDSSEVNAFTSKYDAYLARMTTLTKQEKKGLALFNGKGKCARCHPSKAKQGQPPLFTDFTYDNLGTPTNPNNPAKLADPSFVDLGLGGFACGEVFANDEACHELFDGLQKVPTLRNVDTRPSAGFVKAFTHSGFFKTLKDTVHFYNTRDVLPSCEEIIGTPIIGENCWPPAEVEENINDAELGNLHLTDEEEDAIVAFLKTLSDGWTP